MRAAVFAGVSVGLAFVACLAVSCSPPVAFGGIRGLPDLGPADGPLQCSEGDHRCDEKTFSVCRGDVWVPQETCLSMCDERLGCIFCQPGEGTCSGDVSTVCRGDGSRFDTFDCDPLQGMRCDPGSGECVGDCAPMNLGQSYIGCEYFPTVVANEVDGRFDFAVAVSNTTMLAATVTIDGGALSAPMTIPVAPNSVQVQTLPWVASLKACTSFGQLECGVTSVPSVLAKKGAYHLRSTEPVTVYQFNPLEYQGAPSSDIFGTPYSYTNDASLLLPSNAMTGNYRVASWPTWNSQSGAFPGLLAVTATTDGTIVIITTTTAITGSSGVPSFVAGTPGQVMLDQGDTVELLAYGGDLSGSIVQATHPVQVIGGHDCTQIPFGTQACDHVEESMFPFETLSERYLVSAPALPSLPDGKVEVIRMISTVDATTLVYDPPQAGAPATMAHAGDVAEISGNNADFLVTANHKIIVAQYMEGEGAGGGSGDPAMALAVSPDQYRSDYLFHSPVNYETNYVNIIAPTPATIMLDGAAVSGFRVVGTTGYGVLRLQIGVGNAGNHRITGDQPFGISVYGYGSYTSYWYPGGLNLDQIPVQ